MGCRIHQGRFLSLSKYIAFVNEPLINLKESKLCCSIYGIPSSPAGYADDLATATISKGRTDRVHDIVLEYGRKWCFTFNADKSAVLVFVANSANRVFKLGTSRVKEKASYAHKGVKSCLFPEDESRVLDKISKGRRTLNASLGLGIRKMVLTLSLVIEFSGALLLPPFYLDVNSGYSLRRTRKTF